MTLPSENGDSLLLMTTITKRLGTKVPEIPEEHLDKRHQAIDETRRRRQAVVRAH